MFHIRGPGYTANNQPVYGVAEFAGLENDGVEQEEMYIRT